MTGIRSASRIDTHVTEINDHFAGAFSLTDRYEGFGHSVRGVISGVLAGSEVVVKPFVGSAARGADHEARMLNMLRDLGLPTVRPLFLCFGVTADYLITQYENITPLDQEPLSRHTADELAQLGEEVGEATVELHRNGIIHTDLQPKNVFRGSESSSLGVLDLDGSRLHEDRNCGTFWGDCVTDLTKAIKSFRRTIGRGGSHFSESLLGVYEGSGLRGAAEVVERVNQTLLPNES